MLLPKGVMRPVEDNDREVEENAPEEGEMVLPSTKAMADPFMWVHKNLNILGNCRTAHTDPEEPDGAENWDADEEKKKIEAADPYEPRLKTIAKDTQVNLSKTTMTSAWVVRLMGDATEFKDEKKPNAVVSNGVVVVRSLQWPGAFSFYCNDTWHQVYLGSGHKYEQTTSYFPVLPPTVLEDPMEFPLGPEPTPLEEPVAAKADVVEGEEPAEEDE